MAHQAVPIGIWGPVPPGMLGLILGRSGNTLKGLIFWQESQIPIMREKSKYY